MAKTVVALVNGADQARKTVQELEKSGFKDTELFGTSGGSSSGGDLTSALTDAGVPKSEAKGYADSVNNGGAIVLVHTDEAQTSRAQQIIERHSSLGAQAGKGKATRSAGTGNSSSPGRMAGNQVREEVVEEQMQVGKRPVERAGARIYTRVSERPVEKSVHLREEHVRVDRRDVDRPASEADLRKGDEEIVITERSEEPVVTKQARVVGEVTVGKETRERTATVRDKLRRKDVEVERAPGSPAPDHKGRESEFRAHHSKHDKSDLSFDEARPAYHYGADIAHSSKFQGKDWNSIRSDVRSDWERYNPDTFDEAEHAIKFGWDKAHQTT